MRAREKEKFDMCMHVYLPAFDSVRFANFPISGRNAATYYERREIEIAENIKSALRDLRFIRSKHETSSPLCFVATLNQICDNNALLMSEDPKLFDAVKEAILAGDFKVTTFNEYDLFDYAVYSLNKSMQRMVNNKVDPDEAYICSLIPELGNRITSSQNYTDPKIAILLGREYRKLRYDEDKKTYFHGDCEVDDEYLLRHSFPSINPRTKNAMSFGYYTLLLFIKRMKQELKQLRGATTILDFMKFGNLCDKSRMYFKKHDKNADDTSYRAVSGCIKAFSSQIEKESTTLRNLPDNILRLYCLEQMVNHLINQDRRRSKDLKQDDYLHPDRMKRYFARLFFLQKLFEEKNASVPNRDFFSRWELKKEYSSVIRLLNIDDMINKFFLENQNGLRANTRSKIKEKIESICTHADYQKNRSMAYAYINEMIDKEIMSNTRALARLRSDFTHFIDFIYNVFNALLAVESDNTCKIYENGTMITVQFDPNTRKGQILNHDYQ